MISEDFDSGIRRFDPSRPSHIFQCFISFLITGHIRQTRTIGAHRPHDSRHTPSPVAHLWEVM